MKYYRSTSGSVLNGIHIPSATFELGPPFIAPVQNVAAGVHAILKLAKHAAMLSEAAVIPPRPATSQVPLVRHSPALRYVPYPYVTTAGIVDLLKEPGQRFEFGETMAVIRDMSGNERERVICGIETGVWVLLWYDGVVKYPNQVLGMMLVEDRIQNPVPLTSVDSKSASKI